MDYSSLGSGISESLEFLSPPVKRGHGRIGRETPLENKFYGHPNNGPLLKDYRRTVSSIHPQLPLCEKTVPSSTSLFLKKTSERQILEKYSVFSYTNLNNSASKRKKGISTLQNTVSKDRPLIRVSVFPNNTATQTKSRKRRHAKRVQNTSSNQENSIKANNVYLVVAGRKREKIYELKTTESAEHNKRQTYHYQDEEIAVEHNFKQLLTSLNMETVKSKKKKKGKKKESLDEDVANPGNSPVDSNTYISNSFERPGMINDCSCPFTEKFENNVRQHKNRQSLVKLVGKIGLTEDDNYVLNCAATIDDKPIETYYPRFGIQYNINRNQKDSSVQVDMECLNNRPTTSKYRSIETQCTPINFESVCFSNVDKLKILTQNEEVYPCSCERNDSTDINYLKSDYITPKGKPSPLVIISVYPKQHSKDDNEKYEERKSSPQRLNSKQRTGRSQTRSPSPAKDNKPRRSRSPSPAKCSPKRKGETNKPETGKQRKNKESPDRSNQAISSKKQQKDKPIQDKGTKTTKTIPAAKSPSNKKQQSKGQKSSTPQGTNVEANIYYNTDSMLAKKALVEAYTKKITAQMNTKKPMQWVGAKNDVSNIAVNINSENEFYDVLLRQGRLITDLTVRKTIKEKNSEYGASDDDNNSAYNASASLENFLMQDKDRKRSFSQTFLLNDQTSEAINKCASRINVRDSIELSHRREYSSDHNQLNKSISTSTNNEDNLLFLAPIKHYKGDSCNLPNPVERDKEIRELLGIDKGRLGPSRTTEEPGTANSDRSLHCLYYTRCHNDLLSGEEGSLCNFYKDEELLRAVPNCECDEEQKDEENEDSKESDSQNESDQSDSTPPKKQQTNRQNKSPSKAPSKKSKHQAKYPKDKVSKDEYLERQDVGKYTPANKGSREPSKKSPSRNDTFTDGPLYQQLILNRNINVYLQIEKFTKQKPIVLSHKQYAKVKKTIQSASKKSRKTKMCICKKTSSVSIGEVRRKSDKISKPKPLEHASREKSQKLKQPPKPDSDDEEYDESQKQDHRSCCPCDDNSTKTDKKSKNSRIECLCYDAENIKERKKQSQPTLPRRSPSIQREVRSTSASFKFEKLPKGNKNKSKTQTTRNPKEEILSNETPGYKRCECCGNLQRIQCDLCGKAIMKPCSNCGAYPYNVIQFNTRCYCANETRNKSVFTEFKGTNSINPFKCNEATVNSRKASSSTEIHYTSVAYMKHVTFSSTNVKIPLSPISKLANNYYNSDSLHTIFKGHRKSATPNLGTSEFSLYSDNSEQSHKSSPKQQDLKPRKPFLRRLMSCLVMRSQTSDIKLRKPQHKVPTINSSVDSYHISTSLGAIELSSSIYDTSASFYSNHTIMPVNSKMKRSFLSSVRGFLTNRRS